MQERISLKRRLGGPQVPDLSLSIAAMQSHRMRSEQITATRHARETQRISSHHDGSTRARHMRDRPIVECWARESCMALDTSAVCLLWRLPEAAARVVGRQTSEAETRFGRTPHRIRGLRCLVGGGGRCAPRDAGCL